MPGADSARTHAETGTLRLFLRDDCGLCDRALAVLAAMRAPEPQCVVIDDDAALEARYGTRIQVLADAAGRELDWPFDAAAVRHWLAGGCWR